MVVPETFPCPTHNAVLTERASQNNQLRALAEERAGRRRRQPRRRRQAAGPEVQEASRPRRQNQQPGHLHRPMRRMFAR